MVNELVCRHVQAVRFAIILSLPPIVSCSMLAFVCVSVGTCAYRVIHLESTFLKFGGNYNHFTVPQYVQTIKEVVFTN